MSRILLIGCFYLISSSLPAAVLGPGKSPAPSVTAMAVLEAVQEEIYKRAPSARPTEIKDEPTPKPVPAPRPKKVEKPVNKIKKPVNVVSIDDEDSLDDEDGELSEDDEGLSEEEGDFEDDTTLARLQDKLKNKKSSGGGNSAIEEARKRNREALARQTSEDRKAALDKAAASQRTTSLFDQYINTLKGFKQTEKSWHKEVRQMQEEWKEARKNFLKNINDYEKGTFSLEAAVFGKGGAKSKLKKNPKGASFEELTVIPGAFQSAIKDQGRRPTCAAFSGVRAIEILGASHGKNWDLSEQYFYWASKPECQQNACSSRGSWSAAGYRHSRDAGRPDIPLENACAYSSQQKPSNETQVPLSWKCQGKGVVQVTDWKNLEDMASIIEALNQGEPVVAGLKLSPNFYKNDGLITWQDRNKGHGMDSHSAGHAIVFIGHVKLPGELVQKEGRFCLLTANSWSMGWGAGGYSCITEKWLQEYYIPGVSVSLRKIRVN